jgi:type I restriction enzyme S subunit
MQAKANKMTKHMSKIEKLIVKLCPDGVEFKRLGEVCNIYTGVQFNKRDMYEVGDYPKRD